ncbi:MAG: ATP synthase F0 subunit B [Candidatus Woesebacteria bacterium]|jgi:F-type H+-transporting ATPase subunit b
MNIQLTQIIFQIINFSVIFAAISFLVYKPIQKILDERAKKIARGQEAADKAIEEKERLKKLEAELKKKAELKAEELLEKARKEAEQKKQQMLAAAKEETQLEIEKLRKSWLSEKQALLSQTRKEMFEAVLELSQKLLAKKITSKADEQMIEKELNGLLSKI